MLKSLMSSQVGSCCRARCSRPDRDRLSILSAETCNWQELHYSRQMTTQASQAVQSQSASCLLACRRGHIAL